MAFWSLAFQGTHGRKPENVSRRLRCPMELSRDWSCHLSPCTDGSQAVLAGPTELEICYFPLEEAGLNVYPEEVREEYMSCHHVLESRNFVSSLALMVE
ncbi:hypothetical protein L345_16188 [Ophiophagus hannah]|uniref:Uncharacterized protein n=1 Tax=Ophiophagus hannah TaxID=8665 RepID=V8N857_OPHHA|nr:hypothetical protein L345_16188 [Ophiophagus hannah]